MTTRGLEDLDGGLGSCLPTDDLSFLEEPSGRRPDSKARGTSRLADPSSWTHVLQGPVPAGAGEAGLRKMEKELEGREGATTSKVGTSPRSVPALRKQQAAPPLQPPPPPPPPPSDDLPWGNLTLNRCLVLASLVALLGSALQICRDAVAGESVAAPQQWISPSSPTKKPAAAPKPPVLVSPPGPPQPKPGPPALQAQMQNEPELPRSPEATETQLEPGESLSEASGEEHAPLGDLGSQEKPRKEKPRKGEKLKKEKPRREKPKREKPQVTREPRQSLPRRWEAREAGHRPWRRDSRDLELGKLQAWAPRRRPHDRDDRPRQKPRGGKGRG